MNISYLCACFLGILVTLYRVGGDGEKSNVILIPLFVYGGYRLQLYED